MASLTSININLNKIPKEKIYEGKKGKYIQVTVVQNNEIDQYNYNSSIYVSQSQEERESKADKVYIGNGNVVWTDNKVVEPNTNKITEPNTKSKEDNNLPF
tara:strand:- start:28 stop:330 length:303 start_codon:yes stop_codon:yes gene_type:complete